MPELKLDKNSTPHQIRNEIGRYVEVCVKEGKRDQSECVAIAYSIARKMTGKELDKEP